MVIFNVTIKEIKQIEVFFTNITAQRISHPGEKSRKPSNLAKQRTSEKLLRKPWQEYQSKTRSIKPTKKKLRDRGNTISLFNCDFSFYNLIKAMLNVFCLSARHWSISLPLELLKGSLFDSLTFYVSMSFRFTSNHRNMTLQNPKTVQWIVLCLSLELLLDLIDLVLLFNPHHQGLLDLRGFSPPGLSLWTVMFEEIISTPVQKQGMKKMIL